MVDGHVRDLRGLYPPLCPPTEEAAKKRKLRTPRFAALLVALALTFGVACCWGSIRDFVRKFFIQPVCSWWTGGAPSHSTKSSEDPETTERIEKRKERREEIIGILKNKGEDYLKGLAGLIWVPDSWNDGTLSFPSEGSEIIEDISEGFTARLKDEEWLVEKSDQGGHGNQKKKLINVSEFKENFKNVLSSNDQYFSSSRDEGDYFSKVAEDWGKVNGLREALKNTIKDSGFSPETAAHRTAEDRSTLEKCLDGLLEKIEARKNQGYGYLSFFYGSGEEGYRVLTLYMDLNEPEEPEKSIFVKKSNKWRRIDVSALEKRLDGTPRDRPCIEFNNARREIAFFLKKPQSNREKDGNFKEFLGVFLDDLLDSVEE